MKQYLQLLLVFSLLTSSLSVFAQKTVTGKVTSAADPEGVIGAVVYPKSNKAKGVQTDYEGNYSIVVGGESDFVVVSYTGMETREISVAGKSVVNVKLKEKQNLVQEVTVLGQKETARFNAGNSSSVKGSDISSLPAPSFDAALQGRAPGLQITQGSGVAGSAVNVRIRGTGSISAGSEPLYVVDGMAISSGSNGDGGGAIGGASSPGFQVNVLASINPNDIESIEVLKDAASAGLYGSRGANGVILITTKRGKAGKTKFDFSATGAVQTPTHLVKLANGPEYRSLVKEAYYNTYYQKFVDDNGNITGAGFSKGYITELGFKNPIKPLTDDNNYYTSPELKVKDGFSVKTAENTNTDWMNILLRTGKQGDASVNARGGNEKTQFYVGGSYRNQLGPMIGNAFQRLGARFNIDNQVSQRLKIGLSTSLTYTINNIVPSGGNGLPQSHITGGFPAANTISLPIFPVYWSQTQYPENNINSWNPFYNAYGSTFGGSNLVLTQDSKYNSITRNEFRNISQAFADVKLSEHLTFRSELGLDFINTQEDVFTSRYGRVSTLSRISNNPSSAAYDSRVTTNYTTFSNYLTWDKEIKRKEGAKVKHHVNLMGMYQFQKWNTINNNAGAEDFPNDYSQAVSSGTTPLSSTSNQNAFAFESYFLRTNWRMNNRYIITASTRYDGSSRFGKNNRYGVFPTVGVKWLMDEEKFLKPFLDSMKISTLQLRGSYGLTGNAAIGNFLAYGTYSPTVTYNLFPGTAPSQPDNPNLTWEKNKQLDVSLEIGFFQDRIRGSVTYFNRTSYDMLIAVPAPLSLGFVNSSITQNIGVMRNYGWEFTLTTLNIKPKENSKNKFQWKTDINFSIIKNNIVDVGGLKSSELSGGTNSRTYINHPIGTLYMPIWRGVDPKTGRELIQDLSGNAIPVPYFNSSAQGIRFLDSLSVPIFDKTTIPAFFTGVSNDFKFKSFDLGFLFYLNYGNYILDDGERRQSYVTGSTNIRKSVFDNHWTESNRSTDVPILFYTTTAEGLGFDNVDPLTIRSTTRFVHDGSYLRLRTITLGYTISNSTDRPVKLLKALKISSLRAYAQAFNILTFTSFPGWDPEVTTNNSDAISRNLNIGVTNLDFPQVRTFTLGINLSF